MRYSLNYIMNKVRRYIIFDILFWGLVVPVWLTSSAPSVVNVLLMLVIFSHVRIAVLRYIYGQLDVQWPVWCECLAVFIGLVLSVDGGRRGDLLFASIGFVMMYGHVRKLLHPSSSYYT